MSCLLSPWRGARGAFGLFHSGPVPTRGKSCRCTGWGGGGHGGGVGGWTVVSLGAGLGVPGGTGSHTGIWVRDVGLPALACRSQPALVAVCAWGRCLGPPSPFPPTPEQLGS